MATSSTSTTSDSTNGNSDDWAMAVVDKTDGQWRCETKLPTVAYKTKCYFDYYCSNNECKQLIVKAEDVVKVVTVDRAYLRNNDAALSLWTTKVSDSCHFSNSNANPVKGSNKDVICQCGLDLGYHVDHAGLFGPDGHAEPPTKLRITLKSGENVLQPKPIDGMTHDEALAEQTPFTGTFGAPKRDAERRWAHAPQNDINGQLELDDYQQAAALIRDLHLAVQKQGKDAVAKLLAEFEKIRGEATWQDLSDDNKQRVVHVLLLRLKSPKLEYTRDQIDAVCGLIDEFCTLQLVTTALWWCLARKKQARTFLVTRLF
jgi:hypothetical protein